MAMNDLKATFYRTDLVKRNRDKHLSPLHLTKYRRLRTDWIAFCELMDCRRPSLDKDDPGTLWNPRPTIAQLEAFLTWYARTKKGVLEERVTVQTILNDLNYLRREIRNTTGQTYTGLEVGELEFFVKGILLESEGLSTKGRPKALADLPVIVDVLDFLWQRDEYTWRCPRRRVQLAMGILFIWYMGLRTGEFIHNACSLPNEGILWKDINISLLYESSPSFHVQVTIRNRKGKRGKESTFETENLREEKERWRCPVTLLLALAIEDQALEGIKTAQDLKSIRFNKDGTKRDIRIRDEMRNIPLLRRCGIGSITALPNKILSGTVFAQELRELGNRAGYVEDMTPYNIRRGFGNRLDSKSSSPPGGPILTLNVEEVTEAERSRHFGHQNPVTFQHYLSRTAPCDVQGIMNGHAPDQDRIDFYRSMRSKVDRAAPTQLHASLAESRFRHPRDMGQRRYQQLRARRKEYFARPQEDLFEGTVVHQTFRKTLERPPASRLLQNFLYYDQERSRVIEAMFRTPDCDIFTAVRAVVGLLARKAYPRTDSAIRLHNLVDGMHCYMCTADLKSPEDWEAHCAAHLRDCGLLCGRVVRHGAVLWPGLCPFCLGSKAHPAAARLYQYTQPNQLNRHVESHLRKTVWPQVCPHPHCTDKVDGPEDFWDHMFEVHGYPPQRPNLFPETAAKSAQDAESSDSMEVEDEWHCPHPGCAQLSSSLRTQAAYIRHSETHPMRPCGRRGCSESFRSTEALRNHLFNAHQLSQYTCQLESLVARRTTCGKAFENASVLRLHHVSHERQERLRCPAAICRKQFRKESTFIHHRRSAHGVRGADALPLPVGDLTPAAQAVRIRKRPVDPTSPVRSSPTKKQKHPALEDAAIISDQDSDQISDQESDDDKPIEWAPTRRKVPGMNNRAMVIDSDDDLDSTLVVSTTITTAAIQPVDTASREISAATPSSAANDTVSSSHSVLSAASTSVASTSSASTPASSALVVATVAIVDSDGDTVVEFGGPSVGPWVFDPKSAK